MTWEIQFLHSMSITAAVNVLGLSLTLTSISSNTWGESDTSTANQNIRNAVAAADAEFVSLRGEPSRSQSNLWRGNLNLVPASSGSKGTFGCMTASFDDHAFYTCFFSWADVHQVLDIVREALGPEWESLPGPSSPFDEATLFCKKGSASGCETLTHMIVRRAKEPSNLGECLVLRPHETSSATSISRHADTLDRSLVQDWGKTLKLIVDSSIDQFRSFQQLQFSGSQTKSQSLSDLELLSTKRELGNSNNQLPKLPGADACELRYAQNGVSAYYECYFLAKGAAESDLAQRYIQIIRLSEQTTGVNATKVTHGTIATSEMAVRRVSMTLAHDTSISIDERWLRSSLDAKPENQNRVAVDVFAPAQFANPDVSAVAPEKEGRTTSENAPVGLTDIDSVIRSGRYGSMPPSQRVGSSGTGPAFVSIRNATTFTLLIRYEGLVSSQVSIPPLQAGTLQLAPGRYRVMGRVSAESVLPFIGTETLDDGDRRELNFYVKGVAQ